MNRKENNGVGSFQAMEGDGCENVVWGVNAVSPFPTSAAQLGESTIGGMERACLSSNALGNFEP